MRMLLLPLFLLLAACDAVDVREPAPSGVPDGIYMGLRTNMDGRVVSDFLTFYPDGRVLRSVPSEGLDRPYPGFPDCTFDVCGTYTRSGDEVRIVWGEADEPEIYDVDEVGALQRKGQSQKHRLTARTQGLRVDATYGAGGTAEDPFASLHLDADGTFEEHALMTFTGWAADPVFPDRAGQERPDGSGTYEIGRNTLTLRYDDGQTAYFSIVVPPGEADSPVPASIYVNHAVLDRLP